MGSTLLSRRPLTASTADQTRFVNRVRETTQISRAIEAGLNCYVAGGPGAGKTSLLHHLEAELGDRCRYVNAETAGQGETALAGLLDQIATAAEVPRRPERTGTEIDVWELAAAPGHVVLLIDGVSSDIEEVLFGRYRDALWESSLVWVVAGRSPSPRAPADAFFDQVVDLAPLSLDQTTALLLDRTGGTVEPSLCRRFAEVIAPAQPIEVIAAAQTLALADQPEVAAAVLDSERAAVEALPERLVTVYSAIKALGPTHAGDQRLLDRTGTSRSRITHSLRELEEEHRLVHGHRDGRRVLYQTVASTLLNNPQVLTAQHLGPEILEATGPGSPPMPWAEIAVLAAAVLGLVALAQTT